MKKIICLILAMILISGCASVGFAKSKKSHSDSNDINLKNVEIIESTPTPEPTPEPTPTPEPIPKKVTIKSSAKSVMEEGETVHLTSSISGFDGYEISYQWLCDKGSGFQEVSGANSDSYSFAVTKENLSWNWKLRVYYK